MVDDAPRHPGCPISRELELCIKDDWDGSVEPSRKTKYHHSWLMEDLRERSGSERERPSQPILYDRPIHHHLALWSEEALMAPQATTRDKSVALHLKLAKGLTDTDG
ncbi:hypothetical protein Tco_0530931 [Tanacetum coccineum]